MSAEKPKRHSSSKKRGQAAGTMPKWKAWLMIAVLVFITGVLLWCGTAVVVRCDRGPGGRVDVTVERRLLGWITIHTESVPDVINATRVAENRLTARAGSKHRRSVTDKLMLTPRHGPEWHSPLYTPSFGTRPKAMAVQIDEFMKGPSGPSLTTWWMPWLVNVCAVPFVLLSLFMVGEPLLRALGFFKPASLPIREDS